MGKRFHFNPNQLDSDDPPPERRRCLISGKVIFSDEEIAQHEAERICDTDGTRLKVYYCFECDGWHFTSAD